MKSLELQADEILSEQREPLDKYNIYRPEELGLIKEVSERVMTKKELIEKLSDYPDDSLINIQSDDFNCNFGISNISFDIITDMPVLCPGKPLGPVICISLNKWNKLVRE